MALKFLNTNFARDVGSIDCIGEYADRPCPGRSNVITLNCFARDGIIGFHAVAAEPIPCINTTDGP